MGKYTALVLLLALCGCESRKQIRKENADLVDAFKTAWQRQTHRVGTRPDNGWDVWYSQEGVLDEEYRHNGKGCGWVEGIRMISATIDDTEWYSFSFPKGSQYMKALDADNDRKAAEHRVETSIECQDPPQHTDQMGVWSFPNNWKGNKSD